MKQFIKTTNITTLTLIGLSRHAADDVGVSSISNSHGAHVVEFTAGSSEFDVVSVVVVESGLGKHSVVLDLRLSKITR